MIEGFRSLSPRIHSGAWVHPSVQILGDVVLDDGVSIWPTSVLRGDCGTIHIGARTNVQDGSVCHATTGVSQTSVGIECTIGHRVVLHGCTIGDHCLVGMGSIVLDGAELGAQSFLAAGSLVPPGKKFEPRSFLVGSPAKRIREVTERDLQMIDQAWRTYRELVAGYARP